MNKEVEKEAREDEQSGAASEGQRSIQWERKHKKGNKQKQIRGNFNEDRNKQWRSYLLDGEISSYKNWLCTMESFTEMTDCL